MQHHLLQRFKVNQSFSDQQNGIKSLWEIFFEGLHPSRKKTENLTKGEKMLKWKKYETFFFLSFSFIQGAYTLKIADSVVIW